MNATAPPARLKIRYLDEIRPVLIERFGYTSPMQAPKLEKITLNMGVGSAKQDSKALKAAQDQLATIAGQRPSVRRARKSIAAFKLREGMPVGVAVTLRAERAYEFLDRLISIAIPRIRDFRGLSARSFDGRGNYSLGVREQIIFPEIDYDAIDEVRGLDITITTSAASDPEAYALLVSLGMPYTRQGMPKRLQELADDGLGPAADGPATAQRPQPASASNEPLQETAPEAEPELPAGDASEADLAPGEAPRQELGVENASEPEVAAGEASEPDAEAGASAAALQDEPDAEPSASAAAAKDEREAEPSAGAAPAEEAPDMSVASDGDDPPAEVTAVGDSADASTRDGLEESVSDQAAQASSDDDGAEAHVSGESAQAGSDDDSVEASVSSDPGDDSNDTEDAH